MKSTLACAALAVAALAAPLSPSPAHADPLCKDWQTSDTVLAATYTALVAEDWAQTRWFRAHGYQEKNPILGPTPSPERVNLLIAGGLAAGLGIACYLDDGHRTAWLMFWTLVEAWAVNDNAHQGIPGLFRLSLPPLRF